MLPPPRGRRRRRLRTLAPAAVVPLALVLGCSVEASGSDVTDASQPSSQPTSTTPSTTVTEPTSTPSASAEPGPADAALATLQVRGRAPMTGYARDLFGSGWIDTDRNGCDTRNDILGAQLSAVELRPGTNGCVVATGLLTDPYTGADLAYVRGSDGGGVDIDHVVALGNSWVSGGYAWDVARRIAFANDPLNLLAVDASANRQKGAGDAATWLPSNRAYRCDYAARQVAVKAKYTLSITPAEHSALATILGGCPSTGLPPDSGLPTETDVGVGAPAPPASSTTAPSTTYFENCDAARAAGAAPVYAGDPGYGAHLDRDGDGAACE